MTRRDWWLGIAALCMAVLLHALLPRYALTVRNDGFIRFDHWTGRAEIAVSSNISRVPWIVAR